MKRDYEKECKIPGCRRLFVPGKTGARGLCVMHYQRVNRMEKEPDEEARLRIATTLSVPTPLDETGVSEKLTVRAKPPLAKRVERLAKAREISLSAWIAEAMEKHADREERKLSA